MPAAHDDPPPPMVLSPLGAAGLRGRRPVAHAWKRLRGNPKGRAAPMPTLTTESSDPLKQAGGAAGRGMR